MERIRNKGDSETVIVCVGQNGTNFRAQKMVRFSSGTPRPTSINADEPPAHIATHSIAYRRSLGDGDPIPELIFMPEA